MTRHVFDGLALGRVVHQLVEAFVYVILFVLLAFCCIVGDLSCKVRQREESDGAMKINQSHFAVKVEHEQLDEYPIVFVRQ